ncbi:MULTISPECIES: hypothetical protein [Brevibacillus]|uniref:Uncharacterized protein n=1 Tax=Brevibacillus borstelensis AK1 TaxID=1300222 RepID=M8DC18_9BACL|nr:hypothetical protein [Brevibacillus borstelensis]EMT50953.1 hypothetical protein I532_20146 [Brevibacillus borstelensis AK1]KKX53649.1 hypothetical protein X546_18525 [Brevibacillus borstelensis cifa_chp40]MCC0564106.1 hypothetical protein [Brevibacillus borstelensis]MCM3470776.1 hypothetical protein [Brevibacillus borstelensis]MCM3558882.1 hypothetical protein [Brevibacillus borstelensis]
MWKKGTLLLLVFIFIAMPVSATPEIADLQVDQTRMKDWKELILHCDLIVVGLTDARHQKYPTAKRISAGQLVNYVQDVQIERTLHGSASRRVKLLSTGVEPLPDASDPANLQYPGPLGEGQYLLFLKKVNRTDMYSIVGLWQGVYPLYDGKTVSLRGQGFPELNQLSIRDVADKIRSVRRSSGR